MQRNKQVSAHALANGFTRPIKNIISKLSLTSHKENRKFQKYSDASVCEMLKRPHNVFSQWYLRCQIIMSSFFNASPMTTSYRGKNQQYPLYSTLKDHKIRTTEYTRQKNCFKKTPCSQIPIIIAKLTEIYWHLKVKVHLQESLP